MYVTCFDMDNKHRHLLIKMTASLEEYWHVDQQRRSWGKNQKNSHCLLQKKNTQISVKCKIGECRSTMWLNLTLSVLGLGKLEIKKKWSNATPQCNVMAPSIPNPLDPIPTPSKNTGHLQVFFFFSECCKCPTVGSVHMHKIPTVKLLGRVQIPHYGSRSENFIFFQAILKSTF